MHTPLHVLIGDDSTSFGWVCSEKLKLCGHIANTIHKNGNFLLEAVLKQQPDVVIMDANMKGLNAAELLRELQAYSGRKPVTVVITSYDDDPLEQEIRELGADIYLIRPFDIEELVKKLNSYSTPLTEQKVVLFDPVSFRCTAASKPEGQSSSSDAERLVADILIGVNMPANLKGFYCAKACIVKAVFSRRDLMLTKELYPEVAKEFSCSVSSVERSIRHAIDLTWNQKNTVTDVLNYYFGDRKSPNLCDRPSNGAFIFTLAEHVRSQLNISSFR